MLQKGSCKLCAYLNANPKCKIKHLYDTGTTVAELKRMFPGVACNHTWYEHFSKKHWVNKQKEAKIITDLIWSAIDMQKRIERIYTDCQDNAKKAKEVAKESRDFRDASGCWSEATKALSILKPEEKHQQNVNINLTSEKDIDARLNHLLAIIDEAGSNTCGGGKDSATNSE